MSGEPRVERIGARTTHGLRRAVLRRNRPGAVVEFSGDDEPGTVHLGVRDAGGDLVAVATLLDQALPARPGEPARRIRGMAVRADHQGQGLGRRLLDELRAEATRQGATVLWAAARDSALGFYLRAGFEVIGDGYVTPDTDLAHHTVIASLDPVVH